MKTTATIFALLLLTSCVTMPERHVIKEVHTNKAVKRDQIDRYLECMERFNNLGKKHKDQMETCNTAFNKGE
jgi:hypothetical protein